MLTFPINHWSGSSIPINALRFASPAATRLTRTPSVVGNRNLWTRAGWIKRGQLTALQTLWSADTATADTIAFTATDTLQITIGGTVRLASTQVFRDPGAWMHVVVAFDAANAVAANKLRVYVNGAEITVWTTDTRAAIALNQSKTNTLVLHTVGDNTSSFDGYMADIYLIDGAALAPTTFGSFDADGIWQPGPQYAGAYGTNGFFLDTAVVVGGVLPDSGPNGLTWTPLNFNFDPTSFNFHGSYDSPTDNYCTLNPLHRQGNTMRGGNVDLTNVATAPRVTMGSFYVNKGKWYWEILVGTSTGSYAGIVSDLATEANRGTFPGASAQGYDLNFSNGNKTNNNVSTAYGSAVVANDVVMVAFDADAGKIWFGKNGTWFAGGNPAAGTGEAFSGIPMTRPRWTPAHGNNAAGGVSQYNFGQRAFSYVPPAGFGKLRASSLEVAPITNGRQYMNVVEYTGNGVAQDITTVGFQPDLVIIKRRGSDQWAMYDSVRGPQRRIELNTATNEALLDNGLTAFLANGFSLGALTTVNASTAKFIAYAWKKGVVPGFDIVTYVGTGATRTVPHALGKKPTMMLVRPLTSSPGWSFYHGKASDTPQNIYCNNPDTATFVTSATVWGNTAPTDTDFTVGTSNRTNQIGLTYIAYLWTDVPGFSGAIPHIGNSNADGPHVWTDHAPNMCLSLPVTIAGSRYLFDVISDPTNQRDTNQTINNIFEGTGRPVDIISCGVKHRNGLPDQNPSGGVMASFSWGTHPFKHGRAI